MENNQSLSMVDLAYRKIKEEIETFRLQPGQRLIIRELSERFDIGHTPIKQALNRLVSEGLIDVFPNKGMAVKQLTWNSYLSNVEARRMVELYAVPYAIREARENPAFLPLMQANFQTHRDAFVTSATDASIENYLKIADIEADFHHTIVRTCKNQKILDFYATLGQSIYILYYTFALNVQIRLKHSLEEHQALLRALAEFDADGLYKATNLHIDNTIAHVKKHSFIFYRGDTI
ncbi:GntR family transcriptional regulator [Anaerotruncus sp. AF02-27]|uniref:GntR family transcriptional regulator n=1 Tax=Anaerotruncus sp. AF02-27 TaxID=2292191 RepID=UPI000E470BC2|nr:GntR family transcriptional regulator [Anaerotruncus sp. AF02-27]RGX57025.1 GntR family transcriptional regulator [Anaerotruncus sp. AF02-27]